MAKIGWPQVLSWRLQRQLVDPIGKMSVPAVVRRLCGVQAQVASSAELAVRVRRQSSQSGEVALALSAGRLVKTWAMRGALHLLTPEEAGSYLSLVASTRTWERPIWQRYFGITPRQMETLRVVVREALAASPLTREELANRVVGRRGLAHIGDGLRSSWGTALKPLAWQGDLVFGPSRGNRTTFMLPEAASRRWAGVPDADVAAPSVIAAYLAAFGPATIRNFDVWLAGGGFGKRRLEAWFQSLGDRLAEVDVEGERLYLMAEDVDALMSTRPSMSVRLLPGFDQYVLGPGTADGHVTPPARRSAVSKQAGWISPVVVAAGVVSGTWDLDGPRVEISWFREAGRAPRKLIEVDVARLSSIVGRELEPVVNLV